ncbi:MAG: glycosyltransferase [Clostridia bacterium]|nr:glycosyltransferase [Clostridia bacterium]
MNDKLTVIVPVYNVENYIEDCLKSIAGQDYAPMEVLLVDDGSTDGSAKICEEMALKDDRFCVIHKKNGGLSGARNTGISLEDGEFISFIDSDDALLQQPYIFMIDVSKRHNADIVLMKCVSSDGDYDNVKYNENSSEQEMRVQTFFSKLCKDELTAAWDKLYRATLFDNLRFDEKVLNEDFLLLASMTKDKNLRVVSTDYEGYFYRIRNGSISHSGFSKSIFDAVINAYEVCKTNVYDELKNDAVSHLFHRIFVFFIGMPKEYIKSENEDYVFAREKLREYKGKIFFSKNSFRNKVVLMMFYYFPASTKRIVSLFIK